MNGTPPETSRSTEPKTRRFQILLFVSIVPVGPKESDRVGWEVIDFFPRGGK